MQDDLIPERLVIIETRKLVRESLLTLFLNTNIFPSIHVAQNWPDANFQMKCGASTVSGKVGVTSVQDAVPAPLSTYVEPVSTFAEGLPEWNIEPPAVVVRRRSHR